MARGRRGRAAREQGIRREIERLTREWATALQTQRDSRQEVDRLTRELDRAYGRLRALRVGEVPETRRHTPATPLDRPGFRGGMAR